MHLPTEFLKAIRCNIIEMPMKYVPIVIGFILINKTDSGWLSMSSTAKIQYIYNAKYIKAITSNSAEIILIAPIYPTILCMIDYLLYLSHLIF